jgi:hypothetical protein
MYIVDGTCVDLPPFSDASGPFDNGEDAGTADAGREATSLLDDAPGPEADATPDATEGDDAGFVDPLAACAVEGDVLSIHVAGMGSTGSETETFTALDTEFTANTAIPMQLTVFSPTVPTGLTLVLDGSDGGPTFSPPAPGTYPSAGSGIGFYLGVDGIGAGQAGTVTIEDAQYDTADGAPGSLRSLLLWFSVDDGSRLITGCLRYVGGAPSRPDAGIVEGGGNQ